MRSRPRAAVLIAATLAVAFLCAHAAAGERREKERKPSDLEKGLMIFQSVVKTADAMRPITATEERSIGRAVAKKVFMRYGRRVADVKLNRYVTLVGAAVAARSGAGMAGYRFAIVKNKEANAFAAPGGYIFITTGLLGKLYSEAQLAGVLGHEMAHVKKRHMIETIQRSKRLAGLVELSSVALNKDPKSLSRMVNVITGVMFTTGLDQNLEFEADTVGTGYAAAAGYHPAGLKDFLVRLKAEEGKARSIFFTTHPPAGERIARLTRNVLPRYGRGQVLSKRFRQAMN